MAGPTPQETARALLEEHPRSFSEELGLKLDRDAGPATLFRWLCASILMSARIGSEIAMRAARRLADAGLTTPQKMAGSTWEQRVHLLDEAGYVRYDERTATMLADSARLLLDTYLGDLRNLREAAGHDPARERRLLQEFKGIGETGAHIFLREMQGTWDELYPYADERVRQRAQRLGLPENPRALAELVPRADFPRLTAAIIRAKHR